MTELILEPDYWKRRLREAQNTARHHAIFKCPQEKWDAIANKHASILERTIGDHESVLDCGCGWGRLLRLLPPTWYGDYVGLDLSPDFIEIARKEHPNFNFKVMDLRCITIPERFDWAVLISIRPMVKRHLGDEVWGQIEGEIKRRTSRTLYLEYDESDEGSIEK